MIGFQEALKEIYIELVKPSGPVRRRVQRSLLLLLLLDQLQELRSHAQKPPIPEGVFADACIGVSCTEVIIHLAREFVDVRVQICDEHVLKSTLNAMHRALEKRNNFVKTWTRIIKNLDASIAQPRGQETRQRRVREILTDHGVICLGNKHSLNEIPQEF